MRLLNLDTFELQIFYGEPPKYAILSHVWGDEEVSLQDFQQQSASVKNKLGFSKIQNFGQVAYRDGHRYAWVDTCCIDKTNPTELSEAINSMFRWYKQSSKCYAYLGDIKPPAESDARARASLLVTSRWFTRGWTLQELIAPATVEFYSKDWERLVSKSDAAETIAWATEIDVRILKQEQSLSSVTVGKRMSWASERLTTRPEDVAYCLLGIFGINMPLLYGEGSSGAFQRLQEEILKRSDDHSLLAWDAGSGSDTGVENIVFAPSPRFFPRGVNNLMPAADDNFSYPRAPYMLTNMGLQIKLPIIRTSGENPSYYAVLDCTNSKEHSKAPTCIPIKPITNDERKYRRLSTPNVPIHDLCLEQCQIREIYLYSGPALEPRVVNAVSDRSPLLWSTPSLEKSKVFGLANRIDPDLFHGSTVLVNDELTIRGLCLVVHLYFQHILFPGLSHFGCFLVFVLTHWLSYPILALAIGEIYHSVPRLLQNLVSNLVSWLDASLPSFYTMSHSGHIREWVESRAVFSRCNQQWNKDDRVVPFHNAQHSSIVSRLLSEDTYMAFTVIVIGAAICNLTRVGLSLLDRAGWHVLSASLSIVFAVFVFLLAGSIPSSPVYSPLGAWFMRIFYRCPASE